MSISREISLRAISFDMKRGACLSFVETSVNMIHNVHPEVGRVCDRKAFSAHSAEIASSIRVFGVFNQITKRQATLFIVFTIP